MHYKKSCSRDNGGENFKLYLERVKRNGNSLFFPPFFVNSFDNIKQIVTCASFKLTNKFPNNIVCFKSTPESALTFASVTQFYEDSNGQLKFRARAFKKVVDTFQSPYLSSSIGNYLCTSGVEEKDLLIDFSNITGKCFAFPLKMPSDTSIDPLNNNQHWIFQVIRHAEVY
jgi:hypothetical protein